jgi:hypothetical protein
MAELPVPKEGILLTHFIVSDDVEALTPLLHGGAGR